MQTLKITILAGQTVDGKTQYTFSSSQEYIVLGRDPKRCDIVFVQDLLDTGLGNEHLGLRRSLGKYQLDINTANVVFVDGEAAFEGQEIAADAELQLGELVRVRVVNIDERPRTGGARLPQQGHQVRHNRRALRWVALALLLAASALGYLVYKNQGLERVVAEAMNGHDVVPQNVIEQVTRSVYQVMVHDASGSEVPTGTAWTGPGGAVLTNAHVAERFGKLEKGQQLVIRSSVPPWTTHVVTRVRLHPGYRRFSEMFDTYLPAWGDRRQAEKVRMLSAADVALMEVTDSDALGPPLVLASRETMASLGAGEAIAYVGYPSEGLIPGALKQPVPASHKAAVVRVTDFFMIPREDGNNRLVHHSLPAIGGASGSPIVNTRGEVVAVLSAGQFVPIKRAGQTIRLQNPANINFAQRGDFLYDLLAGDSDVRLAYYEQQWQQALAGFRSEYEVGLAKELETIRASYGLTSDPEHRKLEGVISTPDKRLKRLADQRTVHLDKPGVHLLFVKPVKPADLDIYRLQKEKIVDKDQGKSNFAAIRYESLGATDIDLLIGAVTRNLNATVPYELHIYSWYGDIDNFTTHRLLDRAKRTLKIDAAPETVMRDADGLLDRYQEKFKLYMAGYDVDQAKPGYYLFAAQPVEPGDIDLALLDGDKVVASDKKADQSATVVQHTTEPGESTRVMVFSAQGDLPYIFRVYYWPDRPDAVPLQAE